MTLKNTQYQAGIRLKEGVVFQNYDEGTFTPSFTGLTETPGSGSITKAGVYTRIGRMVFWEVKVTHTGDATTSATSTTTVALPFTATERSVCITQDVSAGSVLSTNVVTTTAAYTGAWTASGQTKLISGSFRV